MSFPYEIHPLEPEVNKELVERFKGERDGFVQIGPKKYIMPDQYTKHAAQYYNFPLRKDDVWIVTYPRSGTTMTQELLWMMMNNLDFEGSLKEDLLHRSPFFEINSIEHEKLMEEVREMNKDRPDYLTYVDFMTKPGYEILADRPSPRLIKTHLPLSLLPPHLLKTCKVIYSARNPKDVCESYFHHNQLIRFHDYEGDFETYWDFFERDLLLWSPFWEHIKEGWEMRDNPNLFFLFYENLVKDVPGTIKQIAQFVNYPFTDEQVQILAKHLHIDNFRENVKFFDPVVPGIVNGSFKKFVRKGKTGANALFTDELLKRADAWIDENTKRTGIQFPA